LDKMEEIKNELKKIFTDLKFEEKNETEVYLKINEEKILDLARTMKEKQFNLLSIFAADKFEGSGIDLFYVFDKENYNGLAIVRINLIKNIHSIALIFPTAYLYEREIADGFGIDFSDSIDKRRLFLHEIYPQNFHPLLKSYKNSNIRKINSKYEEYVFKKVNGEGVYEIPVGPVHAGIIAPGHFRFSVIGETIFNLEIRHFWKHRGLEKTAEGKIPEEGVLFSESICGDETVANAIAYCRAVEKICKIKIPSRAEYLRLIYAEMERIYSLLGDISGMITDIAYPVGASPFYVFREEILRWNEKLCGSRFYKDTIKIGGVNDASDEDLIKLSNYLEDFHTNFIKKIQFVLSKHMVIDRLETTGVIKKELIFPMHLTGPLARASGIYKDARINHPYGLYSKMPPTPVNKIHNTGDVLARFRIKLSTILDSVKMIKNAIKSMPNGKVFTEYKINDEYCFSIVESSRGENIHFLSIKNGKIDRYKVRTASFCNWPAIENAVLGNIVPDFPLINKSLNLSYEGNDL